MKCFDCDNLTEGDEVRCFDCAIDMLEAWYSRNRPALWAELVRRASEWTRIEEAA